ncbi:DUF721 domain-containing protein [Rhodovulum sp. DZ06]|uniref:DUF721 domain-containing protein n=1 Tax=Rhodovulum sp. DZ06 TaxID=3425126 RepID=UPI003D34F589
MAGKDGSGSGRGPRGAGGKPPAAARAPGAVQRRKGPGGFKHAASLADGQIRTALHRRGFAEAKVLTDWALIAGEALDGVCRPLRVSYGSKAEPGFGATLVLAVAPGRGPEVQMQGPRIVERVNAFYGYRAISRIRVDQRAGGFEAASRNRDRAGERLRPEDAISPEDAQRAARIVGDVQSPELGAALARLGRNVIGRARAADKKDRT